MARSYKSRLKRGLEGSGRLAAPIIRTTPPVDSVTLLVAEVKTRSPFGFVSALASDQLFEIADRVGNWIAIHTDPRWGGSWELLRFARTATRKPILAKGIHENDDDIRRAVHLGADYVLVVGRVPGCWRHRCIIEPSTCAEAAALPPGRVLWNARDLETGGRKNETFADARRAWTGWLCQASFVRTPADVDPRAQAVLVGEHLPEYAAALEARIGVRE